jgi:hypothetical protein
MEVYIFSLNTGNLISYKYLSGVTEGKLFTSHSSESPITFMGGYY